jgi:hypothetical protein
MVASLTITNYELFLDWGWETNRLPAGNITIQNAGKIRHPRNTALTNPVGGIFIECVNLTLASGGQIDADAVGYPGGVGALEGSPTNAGFGHGGYNASSGGGGGYGGAGGASGGGAHGGATYGNALEPVGPGSGGGGGAGTLHNTTYGGAGGGYVKIVAAGTVTLGGNGITANGGDSVLASASRMPGGGSGGGINIRCSRIAGSGNITANGGTSGGQPGGGGGGGRIAIYAIEGPFYTGGALLSATITANGGASTGGGNGSAGTIYRNFKPRGTMFSAW